MLALLLAGGLAVATGGPAAAAGAELPRTAAERAARPFPRAIDGVSIPLPPQRVVAASVFSAEVLLELLPEARFAGLHFLASEPRYSRVAARAAAMPKLGASPEQLIAAKPDLVVIDEFTSADTAILLGSVGIPVVRTRPVANFDDVAQNVRLLGHAVGADEAAEAVCERLLARREAIRAKGEGLGAFRVMNLNGALDTYGSASLLDDAVRTAGATHLPAVHGVGGYRHLDIETVLSWRPDAIVVSVDDTATAATGDGTEWLAQHPGLRLLPCVQKGRVVRIPGSLLSNTSHHAIEVAARLQSALRAWGRP